MALVVPRILHLTTGDQSLPVAAARMWENVPQLVTSSQSLKVFRRRLKTGLFIRSSGSD